VAQQEKVDFQESLDGLSELYALNPDRNEGPIRLYLHGPDVLSSMFVWIQVTHLEYPIIEIYGPANDLLHSGLTRLSDWQPIREAVTRELHYRQTQDASLRVQYLNSQVINPDPDFPDAKPEITQYLLPVPQEILSRFMPEIWMRDWGWMN
jgi:hypothetical protein